ncbi:baeRF11 domain-containing protein [Alsobacter sp. R-9]
MLHVDIPTRADFAHLGSHRDPASVSIYVPTTPLTQDVAASRTHLKNLAKEAMDQLQAADADKRAVASLAEHLDHLLEDDAFWQVQARSLAVFATPDNVRTFRLPNALHASVEVSDRFHLTPLLRAVAFPNAAHVLALSEGAVRLVEVSPDLPAVTVRVAGLPADAASAVGRASVNQVRANTRLEGGQGQKVLLAQYARQVDRALRPMLTGSDIPLILASTEPLLSIYRSVNTYAHLAGPAITASPDRMTDGELSDQARAVLDGIYRGEVAAWAGRFAGMENRGRATTDVAQAARAATIGAVESLLVDIDQSVLGTLSDDDGAVRFADHASARSYDVLGEIATRVIRSGGRVLGVRQADIPGSASLAAILRYPL